MRECLQNSSLNEYINGPSSPTDDTSTYNYDHAVRMQDSFEVFPELKRKDVFRDASPRETIMDNKIIQCFLIPSPNASSLCCNP